MTPEQDAILQLQDRLNTLEKQVADGLEAVRGVLKASADVHDSMRQQIKVTQDGVLDVTTAISKRLDAIDERISDPYLTRIAQEYHDRGTLDNEGD